MSKDEKFKELTGLDWKTIRQYIDYIVEKELELQVEYGYDKEGFFSHFDDCEVDGSHYFLDWIKQMAGVHHKEEAEKMFKAEYESEFQDKVSDYYYDLRAQQEQDELSRGPL